ncbi:MAG TPA: hypothetical protein VFT09_05655 [Ilumatobacteraceae bacterium]|nr:hypothetical protein [Ilumatobacteraceae bacterium]
MRDVIVLAVIAVFFVLCVAYVRWCDHIIGPDPDDLRDGDGDDLGVAAAGHPVEDDRTAMEVAVDAEVVRS